MNKFMLAFALGAGLTLSLAAPSAQADPMIQTLTPDTVSSSTFNSLFSPLSNAPVMSQPFMLANANGNGQTAGTMNSEVFQGTGAAAGLYAYAYQVAVLPTAIDSKTNTPMHVDGTSFLFNGNPITSSVLGPNSSSFLVSDGTIGGLTPLANGISPNSLSFQVNGTGPSATGSLRANFVNPTSDVPPLNPGDNSATFVVLSNQNFSQSFVNVTSATPQTAL